MRWTYLSNLDAEHELKLAHEDNYNDFFSNKFRALRDLRIHGFGVFKSPENNQKIKFNWKINGVVSADYTATLTKLDVNSKLVYHVDMARHFHLPPIKLEKGKIIVLSYQKLQLPEVYE